MIGRIIIALSIICLGASSTLLAQDLNIGAKFGFGFTDTEFIPREFTFSTADNETAYIAGISSENMFIGPVFHLEYKSKNRFGVYFDLSSFTNTYEFVAQTSSFDQLALETPKLSTFYLQGNIGFTIDIVQNKLIKPYLRFGASINGLLGVDELRATETSQLFSQQSQREVRNAIMFDYIIQQNSIYYSANLGLGFKVYNFFVEGIIDRSLTEIDANGAYPSQSKLIINVGVNLLRFDLVKKQKYED